MIMLSKAEMPDKDIVISLHHDFDWNSYLANYTGPNPFCLNFNVTDLFNEKIMPYVFTNCQPDFYLKIKVDQAYDPYFNTTCPYYYVDYTLSPTDYIMRSQGDQTPEGKLLRVCTDIGNARMRLTSDCNMKVLVSCVQYGSNF